MNMTNPEPRGVQYAVNALIFAQRRFESIVRLLADGQNANLAKSEARNGYAAMDMALAQMREHPSVIDITVEGGVIQDVSGIPAGVEIRVMDFDTDGADNERLSFNAKNEAYIESKWSGAHVG